MLPYFQENRRYDTFFILYIFQVTGLQRKYNYQGRFQELISLSTECLGKLFEIAGRMKRNYILDQVCKFLNTILDLLIS